MKRGSGLQAALIEAIEDEYRARASYAAGLVRALRRKTG